MHRSLSAGLSLLVALLVLVSAQTARSAPAESDTKEQRALRLFQESAESYRAGRFGEAAQMLREAYALFPRATLLYNLGRALEGQGELSGAVEAYRRYLAAEPNITDRASIEHRIETLSRQLADHERLVRESAQQREALQSERRARAKAQADAKVAEAYQAGILRRAPMTRERRAVPWVIAGVGAASLIAGGALGAVASFRHDDAARITTDAETATSLQSDARTFALTSTITLSVGGVLAAVGLIWGIVDAVRVRR